MMEMELSTIMMSNGHQTAQEWLMTQTQKYQALAEEARFECLRKGWILNDMTIQSTAREIDALRNPKGW